MNETGLNATTVGFMSYADDAMTVFNVISLPFYVSTIIWWVALSSYTTQCTTCSLFRYRHQKLKSSFFMLSIYVGCVDVLEIIQRLLLIRLAKKFYPNFVLRHEAVSYKLTFSIRDSFSGFPY